MNTAPASAADWQVLRDNLRRLRTPIELEQMQAIAASNAFRSGEVDAEMEYYRLHFRPALAPELIDPVVDRLRAHLTAEDVRRARAIEDRLYDETRRVPRLRPGATTTHAERTHLGAARVRKTSSPLCSPLR